MNKANDNPGPQDYRPVFNQYSGANIIIGTGARSSIAGDAKTYMFPGPGEYDTPSDERLKPKKRIGGTFGTAKKTTYIKKSFAPGPGSYSLPSATGNMPYYLR